MEKTPFQQYVELIISLTDNQTTLQQSELILVNLIKQSPDFFMLSSVAALKIPNFATKYKYMISILLRQRTTIASNLMDKIPKESFEHIKRELIEILNTENDQTLLRAYSNLVSTMCVTILVNKGSWNELLEFLANNWVQSSKETHRILSTQFFAGVAQSEELFAHINIQSQIAEIFRLALCDSSIKVRLNALIGVTHLHSQFYQLFQPLLPNVIELIAKAIEEDEEIAQTAISKITDKITTFIIPNLPQFISLMFSILSNTNLDAVEFLTSVCEEMPSFVRKNIEIVHQFIPFLFTMMMEDLDDDIHSWSLSQEEEENESLKYANEIIDRISLKLRGKTLVPIFFKFIPQFLSNENWKFRFAGLNTLSSMGEGCRKFLSDHVDKLLDFVLPTLNDQNERVRWGGCNTLGQMCTDFAPNLQINFHHLILPKIISLMDDHSSKVCAHSVAVIINFCESIDPSILIPYLNNLLEKLANLLGHSSLSVVENTIISISSVSDCVLSAFSPYYKLFMERLNPILKQTIEREEYRKIGGLIFETMASIATAVGREIFQNDSSSLLEIIFQVKGMIEEDDDPRIESINNSLVKLVQVMKDQFAPYFGRLLPDLLLNVQLNPRLEYLNLETLENKEDYKIMNIDENSAFGINTSEIEDKIESCRNLSIYIDEMGESFHPWIETIYPITRDHLLFEYSKEVKTTGAHVASALVQSAILIDKKGNQLITSSSRSVAIFHYLFPALYNVIKVEKFPEYLSPYLYTLAEMLEVGKEGLTNEINEKIQEIISISLQMFIKKNNEYELAINDPNFDPEDKESLDNDLEFVLDVLSTVSDVIGKMIELLGDLFFPSLLPLLPLFSSFLSAREEREKCKQAAICLYDDVIRHSQSAREHCLNWLPSIIENCKSKNLATVQAASFGLGISAEFLGNAFIPFIFPSIETVLIVSSSLNRKRKKEGKIAENSISALAKIIFFHSSTLNNNLNNNNNFSYENLYIRNNENNTKQSIGDYKSLLQYWFSCLPVSLDEIECQSIYSFLCRFILLHPEIMFGDNLGNLPKIISIFGDVIGTSLISQNSSQLIKDIFTQIQAQIPADILQQIYNTLHERQIVNIRNLMST